jgi:hypothetical protein
LTPMLTVPCPAGRMRRLQQEGDDMLRTIPPPRRGRAVLQGCRIVVMFTRGKCPVHSGLPALQREHAGRWRQIGERRRSRFHERRRASDGSRRSCVPDAPGRGHCPRPQGRAMPDLRTELRPRTELILRALVLWPRLDRRALSRCSGDVACITRLVAKRSALPEESIEALLRERPAFNRVESS